MASEQRLIDANKLESKLQEHHDFFVDGVGGFRFLSPKDKARVDEITNCIAEVVNSPTMDAVELKHGRWREKILVGGFAEEWGFVCSECGCTVSDRSNLGIGRYASNNQRLNYCPNCGAKMDGDGDGT